jgi:hypothetical protein
MSGSKSAASTSTVAQPLHWWRIAARSTSGSLPFLGFFEEGRAAWQEDEMPLELKGRVAVPVEVWPDHFRVGRWGKDTRLIEDWFDAGEELQNVTTELTIEEPDRWAIALQWMRSLAVATGLRPT